MMSTPVIERLEMLSLTMDGCKSKSGSNERMKTFRSSSGQIQDLIRIIYDPYQKFGVTSKSIQKYSKTHSSKDIHNDVSLLEVLTCLSEGEFTGHKALQICLNFVTRYSKYSDCIYKAINKDLKIRVGTAMVNKAFPFLVPEFSCALGHVYSDHSKFFNENKNNFFVSRKLDGVRCIIICQNGKCKIMSRSGHEYPLVIPGLKKLTTELNLLLQDVVLDGEMTVVDDVGVEHFNIVNSLMNVNARSDGKRGKNTLSLQPGQKMVYQVFDYIKLSTFQKKEKGIIWAKRQEKLSSFCHSLKGYLKDVIHMLPQYGMDKFDELWEKSSHQCWEGLMYRLNDIYEGKKSRNMLKRKLVLDQEFEVLEVINDAIMPPSSTSPQQVCAKFRIIYKNCDVWVGSGLSWEQRVEYAIPLKIRGSGSKRKTLESTLLNQHVTIAYTEESVVKNHSGEVSYSLRFPRLKSVHGVKRKK